MSRSYTPFIILAVGAIIAGGIFFFTRTPGEPTSKKNTVDTTIQECEGAASQQFSCLKTRFHDLVMKRSVKEAFDELKTMYNMNTFVQSSCHQLTHIIGRATAERYGDVPTAFSYGDSFCWSGHYHGVMEFVVAKLGLENLEKEMPNICKTVAEKSRYSFDHYNCVHGLGHGVMGVNSNELFVALKSCDALTDWWERESCYGGVFMENVMVDFNNETTTKYLKPEDPMYPCNAVEEKYKQQCYLMQTSYALKVQGYNFKTVFADCDKVEEKFRNTCYQSLGRDASGNTVSNIQGTNERCVIGKDVQAVSNCVIGAVKDFISYHHDDSEARKLCDTFEPDIRDICLSTATEYYKTF